MFTLPLSAETLREVLRQTGIPQAAVPPSELDSTLTSWSASSDGLIAYYLDDSSGLLDPPLKVLQYDRNSRRLARTSVKKAEVPLEGIEAPCLGAVLSIQRQDGFVYIETHINPSAGCIVVLDSGLRQVAVFYGWLLAFKGSLALYHESQVHFAPTHPMRVSVFDAKARTSTKLYPPQNDAYGAVFAAEIKDHLPSAQWCMEHNHHCDPNEFDSGIDGKAQATADGFTFRVQMNADSCGESAAEAVKPLFVEYRYRLRNGIWQHSATAIPR